MSKIILCGGGTAGHVMPNVALLPQLKKHFDEIHYIGTNGIEKNIIQQYPFVKYHEIECVKLVRSLTPKNLLIPFKLIKSINTCKKIIKEIKPNVIFSKGGYASLPIVLASKNIPVIAHESDYTMGLANKIIYRKTKTMFFSFEETAGKYNKGILSGPPIRDSILNGNKLKAKNIANFTNNLPTILVVGGSMGAKGLNELIYRNIKEICKEFNVVHITGKYNSNIKHQNYFQINYAENIEDYLALCDIVVSRAGSNAIFEFLALQKPMLLIPLPKASSRGDQILNAQYFEKHGWAITKEQEKIEDKELIKSIRTLYKDRSIYIKRMKDANVKNGKDIILNELIKYK